MPFKVLKCYSNITKHNLCMHGRVYLVQYIAMDFKCCYVIQCMSVRLLPLQILKLLIKNCLLTPYACAKEGQ